jgi:hypothetical protein
VPGEWRARRIIEAAVWLTPWPFLLLAAAVQRGEPGRALPPPCLLPPLPPCLLRLDLCGALPAHLHALS